VVFANKHGKPVGRNVVAAKFVSCVGLDCVACDDSAFGGGSTVVPEPGPAGLVLLGLALLAQKGRRQRRI
jgi:MYXO-CTERM domain-containing protein